MKYFIVNNNFHIFDVENHISGSEDICLIVIPHTINLDVVKKYGYKYKVIESPFTKGYDYLKVSCIVKIKKEIRAKFHITKRDILYIHAEEEWLCHYFAKLFHRIKSDIYLLEDGGISNYVKFTIRDDNTSTVKSKLKAMIISSMWGFKGSYLLSIKGISYPMINDSIFKAFICYFNIRIERNIPVQVIVKKLERITGLNNDIALFLNEGGIYSVFTDFHSYICELEWILSNISRKYRLIIFKFHPRETVENRNRIRIVLAKIKNLRIIEENIPVEQLYQEIKPGYVLSYYSVGLINAYFRGIVPVYLYIICKSLNSHPFSNTITRILKSINYQFINSIEDINQNYNCGILGIK